MRRSVIALSLVAAAAVLLPVETTTAQQASVTYYGKPCQGGAAPFTVIGLPQLGKVLLIQTLSGHRIIDSVGAVQIMFGVSDKVAGGLKLPFDTSRLASGGSFFCGPLLQSAEVWVPVPAFHGMPQTVRVPFQVPNDANLIGATAYAQVVQRTVGLGRTSHTLTAAAKLVVGRS